MKLKTIDQVIEFLKANEGEKVIQCIGETGHYYLTYIFGDFFLEAYTVKEELRYIERVSEETARFSLTAKYA